MVEAGNTGAQQMYREAGYLPVGESRDYYGRGRNGIWMQKTRPR
jgi:ribosomal-protein-alanine N-acetyltransferase